ncbi:pre-mRNA-splicing factor ATP-dependent RNA helicase DHX15-like [Aphidius gifuensis]|uniref:pre-mRNA-splicing factor ATP-dependent RNA helicase DHX15-like n=1 Tax=Aphidius gifuensis TaxID=684658 RepID=UPI001CDCB9BB|nr:pre-mRNA-splicing factor ATP-dependent RNA helicase DHX15-like [Aphidius gifuensis]
MATAMEIDDNKCASLQKNINPFTKQPYSEKYLQDLKKRKRLPVYNFQQIFMDLLEEKQNKCIIVTGSGSGKSTQIPQWCLEYSRKINNTKSIVCTQPQKGAAIELAKRVASEIDVKLGTIVGYNVRSDRIYDETTKLIFMTPEVLLHEVISNIKIDKYHIIIIDEAHERQINIDMLISLLYYSLKNTDDLKIIIMGATLDAAKFQNFFDKSPLLSIPGFTYPIEIIYDNECTVAPQNGIHEILEKIAVLVVQIHFKNTNGDILVFLPGKEDILNTEKYINFKLKQTSPLKKLSIIHLNGQLSKSNQDKALKKRQERIVILETNIAETSSTIDNIMFVIDSGYIKESHYN